MAVPSDLKELLEAGSHFGHQIRRWNPKMAPYIFTARDGVHVFDLTITARKLNEACDFVRSQAAEGKVVVFVGTKRQAKAIVKEEALRVEAPFICERWIGGMLTNWDEISKRIKKLNDMKKKWTEGFYDKYTKQERVWINREIERLERLLGGVSMLTKTPDVLFVVDTSKEIVAVKEAVNRGVIVAGITDSNSDPDLVNYVIPANDDAVRSIKYIVNRIANAYGEGKASMTKKAPVANPALEDAKKKLSGSPKPRMAKSK